jgi:Ca-activated chloride channel family protein
MSARAAWVMILCLATAAPAEASGWRDLWLTPDQQGQRLLERGEFAEAAQHFTTPERIGYAWFRAGDFEKAAAVYGRVPGAEGAFNRGNALVMLGQYEGAIASYDSALAHRPAWAQAQENRNLAQIRLAALAAPEDDAGGTGGMLGADEVVIDTSGRVAQAGSETVVDEPAGAASDEALRALWLRKVDTGPGPFLAIRFQYQLARQERVPHD